MARFSPTTSPFASATKAKKRTKRKRSTSGGGKRGNAWRAYVGSSGGGRYVPSNEPLPD
jgi:hypothetical protein